MYIQKDPNGNISPVALWVIPSLCNYLCAYISRACILHIVIVNTKYIYIYIHIHTELG